MKFCSECENMLYTKNCGFESKKKAINEDCAIYTKDYNVSDISCEYIINEHTYKDPTLPRVNDIKCKNPNCPTNQPEFPLDNREVVYIKYDKENMYFVYICCHPECKHIWKNIV